MRARVPLKTVCACVCVWRIICVQYGCLVFWRVYTSGYIQVCTVHELLQVEVEKLSLLMADDSVTGQSGVYFSRLLLLIQLRTTEHAKWVYLERENTDGHLEENREGGGGREKV